MIKRAVVEVVAEILGDDPAVHRAEAVRLLRHAADFIESGQDLGGFYFSPERNFTGTIALKTFHNPPRDGE